MTSTIPQHISRFLGTPIICLLLAANVCAQENVAEAQQHIQDAFTAYGAEDFDGFRESLETATRLNPASLATRYYLARAYALTGRQDESFALLNELVDMKVDYGFAAHPNLQPLHDDPRFAQLLERIERELAPTSNARHRHTIDQLGLIPEGIAIDANTGRTFVSSMRSGDIFVLDSENRLSAFASVSRDVEMAAIGLFVDSARDLLWAVGASFEMTQNHDPEGPQQTGIFGFNLASGQLEESHLAGDLVEFLNDLTVGPDGTIYISGSDLAVLHPGSENLELMETQPRIVGSNGVTISADGKTLFVSAYPSSIAAVDLASGAAKFLEPPPGTSLYGVDGMYFHEGSLLGVQNGAKPWRLLQVDLNAGFTEATNVRILEYANPAIDPTTGAILNGDIHLIGTAPPPLSAPSQFAPALLPFLGKTVIYTLPLD